VFFVLIAAAVTLLNDTWLSRLVRSVHQPLRADLVLNWSNSDGFFVTHT
jgi:hypothetical protein